MGKEKEKGEMNDAPEMVYCSTKGEMIGMKTMERLCELLKMQPGDIVGYVENELEESENII